MAAQPGRDLLIKVYDTTAVAFKSLGGTTECSLTIGNEQVDVTDKSSNGNREALENAGTTTWSMSASGWVKNQDAYGIVQSAAHANTQIRVQIVNGLGDIWECTNMDITSFEVSGGTNDAEAFSISLESATLVTFTPNGGSAESRAIIDPDA